MNLEVAISDSFSLTDAVTFTANVRVTLLNVEAIVDRVSGSSQPLHRVSMLYVEALVDSIFEPWQVFEA